MNTPNGRYAGSEVFFVSRVTFRPLQRIYRRQSRSETPYQKGSTMNRLFAASALTAAVGLALTMQASTVRAQGAGNPPQIVKDNMARMAKDKLEKCYGINAAAKNDCAEGAHSCAGQATQARDTKSFVLLPAGDCAKIQGGKTTSA
jgi:uncharacterized membrane protein